MSMTVLGLLLLGQLVALIVLRHRRAEVARIRRGMVALADAKATGSHRARLQHPHVDLSRCIGCETCVRACPEDGVLELIHGQATIVHGARCVGHGLCAEECPVGAIALTLGDLSERRDLPVLSDEWESSQTPGLFLAGEVTGYALIRTAIEHGRGIADSVAARCSSSSNGRSDEILDLCVVGAGPAGLACALQAKVHGLRFEVVEQEQLGGTVASYPRRKLVMTQPVDLPLHGRLKRTSYTKEELMELWQGIAAEHELPITTGVQLLGVEPEADHLLVRTTRGELRAHNVCLALGRRGTPRKLDVPGEDLPKVAYSLIDAQSYRGRRILVVGGGDSAIEAALGLAEQPGNSVSVSYRRADFSRLKARNDERVRAAMQSGQLEVLFETQVERIDHAELTLCLADGTQRVLPNDEVFVMAGGIPPFKLLEDCGVSFDPEERAPVAELVEQGSGLLRALVVSFLLALATLSWILAHADYYLLPVAERFESSWHEELRPAGTLGLALGLGATLLIVANLSYLVRRSRLGRHLPGSLKAWMSAHVVTGILAMLFVIVHSAMATRDTVGGRACAALAVLLVTGAIGRYLYSFVPRAANGRELEHEEVRGRLAAVSREWGEHGRGLDPALKGELDELLSERPWEASFFARLGELLTGQVRMRKLLARLRRSAREQDVPDAQVSKLGSLARQAHRTSLMAAHYEDVRGLLASWRYLHRWVALLMVVLVGWHIVIALQYGGVAL